MKKDIFKNCPFCGAEHLIPQEVSKGIICQCGAYGQTDEESDAYLFPQDAGDMLRLSDPYEYIQYPEKYLDIRDGGVILEGDKEDPERIILQWARLKQRKEVK